MSKFSREEVRRLLGTGPEAVADELADFPGDAQVLSSDDPRLINEHPMEWVAVFQDHVAARARSP